jgi:hypothetical protein
MKKRLEPSPEDSELKALKTQAVQDYIASRPERPIQFDLDSPEYDQAREEVLALSEFIKSKKESVESIRSSVSHPYLNRAESWFSGIQRDLENPRSRPLEAIRKDIRDIKTELNRKEQEYHLKKLQEAKNPFSKESWEERVRLRQDAEMALELLDVISRAKKPKDLSTREESLWQKIIVQAKGLKNQYGLDNKIFIQEAREVIERSAEFQKVSANYLERFLAIRSRLEKRAKTLGEQVTDELFKRLKPELVELAKKELASMELDEALDEILVSAF